MIFIKSADTNITDKNIKMKKMLEYFSIDGSFAKNHINRKLKIFSYSLFTDLWLNQLGS